MPPRAAKRANMPWASGEPFSSLSTISKPLYYRSNSVFVVLFSPAIRKIPRDLVIICNGGLTCSSLNKCTLPSHTDLCKKKRPESLFVLIILSLLLTRAACVLPTFLPAFEGNLTLRSPLLTLRLANERPWSRLRTKNL